MRPYMTSAQFWSAAFERAVKSFAQGCLAALAGKQVGWWEIDWQHTLGAGLMMALLSLLTSLASDRIGQPGPSLVKEAVEVPVEVAAVSAPFVYPEPEAPTHGAQALAKRAEQVAKLDGGPVA